MSNVKLYRRRFIPDEKILLKDDVIVSYDDERLVTRWNVLTKRHDFTHGVSCCFLKKGWKISRFLDKDDNLVYWYCDIIEPTFGEDGSVTVNDLLVDVIIYPSGEVRVVDIDEVAQALKDEIIPKELIIKMLTRLDSLLGVIYDGNFGEYAAFTEV